MNPKYELLRPSALSDALIALHEHGNHAVVLAGGTDVIVGIRQADERFVNAKALVDISALRELRGVAISESECRIGAATTFGEIATDACLQKYFPLLAQAAASVGSVQIRNRATLGGNFVNNAACADSVPPLLVYDAKIAVRSVSGMRKMPLHEFLLRPNQTALEAGELVTEILLPVLPNGYRGRFYKLGRRRGIAISRLTLAALLKQTGSRVDDIRIAGGAVMPIGTRFHDLESRLIGKIPDENLWMETAQNLGRLMIERTGLRWSSAYKIPVVQQLLFGLLSDLAGEKS